MEHLTLRWAVAARYGLYRCYGHVVMFGGRAYGQWLCVDIASGEVLWERRLGRANTICAVTDNVIVATELRSDGPWTLQVGVYGIDARTGVPIWKSHRDGLLGSVCNALDLLPGITNEIRDAPVIVNGCEVECQSGRVLDLATGRCIRRIVRDRREEGAKVVTITSDKSLVTPRGDLTISTANPRDHHRFVVTMERAGKPAWELDAGEMGFFVDGNSYSWRVVEDCLLLIGSPEPQTVSLKPEQPFIVRRNPTTYDVWAVNLRNGEIVQTLPIAKEPATECRIECISGRHMLVSASNKYLLCVDLNPVGLGPYRSGGLDDFENDMPDKAPW